MNNYWACSRCAYEVPYEQRGVEDKRCPDCGRFAMRHVRRSKPRAMPSTLERAFITILATTGRFLPRPARNYRFLETRYWRADFAWPAYRVIVELEGGVRNRGRHVRPEGYAGDIEKYNAAALAGWIVLRYTADMLADDPLRVVDEVGLALNKEAM